jgi:hypothetical protein
VNRILLVAILALSVSYATPTEATVIEVGDLNIIDDAGNPSDGLRFLDMTYSDGLTLAAALANAQATYANARIATPDEWDDLFAAVGVVYCPPFTCAGTAASNAFEVGTDIQLNLGGDPGLILLEAALGLTTPTQLNIWTDPDGSTDAATTRDYMLLQAGTAVARQFPAGAPNINIGWLIVSEPTVVPEPGTVTLMTLSALALGLCRRRAGLR